MPFNGLLETLVCLKIGDETDFFFYYYYYSCDWRIVCSGFYPCFFQFNNTRIMYDYLELGRIQLWKTITIVRYCTVKRFSSAV